MMILCLDTSTDYAIGAVCDENGQLYGGSAQRHERSLSTRLYPMLDALLFSANVSLEQIDAFAAGIGPGSFTGVRVAVTTMRTLAQTLQKPLVAVATLEAVARTTASGQDDLACPVCALLPSRRNEAYVATYHGDAVQAPPAALSYHDCYEFAMTFKGKTGIVAGPGDLLNLIFPERREQSLGIVFADVEHPAPSAVAALTGREARARRFQDPLSLDPMYVAPPAVSQHKTHPAGP